MRNRKYRYNPLSDNVTDNEKISYLNSITNNEYQKQVSLFEKVAKIIDAPSSKLVKDLNDTLLPLIDKKIDKLEKKIQELALEMAVKEAQDQYGVDISEQLYEKFGVTRSNPSQDAFIDWAIEYRGYENEMHDRESILFGEFSDERLLRMLKKAKDQAKKKYGFFPSDIQSYQYPQTERTVNIITSVDADGESFGHSVLTLRFSNKENLHKALDILSERSSRSNPRKNVMFEYFRITYPIYKDHTLPVLTKGNWIGQVDRVYHNITLEKAIELAKKSKGNGTIGYRTEGKKASLPNTVMGSSVFLKKFDLMFEDEFQYYDNPRKKGRGRRYRNL